jgi:MYXO-CTERM domain-containing protein
MRSFAAAAIVLVSVISTAARADIIYDNTSSTFTGSRSFTSLQIGDEVTAGGTARVVTDLEIGVNSQGVPATVSTLQAFLYANDGTGGAPGTLLWDSSVLQNVSLTGGSDLIAFAVPSITVPDTFTWAIQIGPATPVAAGLPNFGAPSVGSYVSGWFGGPGSWTPLPGALNLDLARITATTAVAPEPSSFVIAGVGALGLIGAWVRRRRVAP